MLLNYAFANAVLSTDTSIKSDIFRQHTWKAEIPTVCIRLNFIKYAHPSALGVHHEVLESIPQIETDSRQSKCWPDERCVQGHLFISINALGRNVHSGLMGFRERLLDEWPEQNLDWYSCFCVDLSTAYILFVFVWRFQKNGPDPGTWQRHF